MKNRYDFREAAKDVVRRSDSAKNVKRCLCERFEAKLYISFVSTPEFSEDDFVKLVKECGKQTYTGGLLFLERVHDCISSHDTISYRITFEVKGSFTFGEDEIAYMLAIEDNIREGLKETWKIEERYLHLYDTMKVFCESGQVVIYR